MLKLMIWELVVPKTGLLLRRCDKCDDKGIGLTIVVFTIVVFTRMYIAYR